MPHVAEVREELDRVLAGAAFRDTHRLRSFLKFVVETTLGGDGDRIKAYTIAVEAFGRGNDFDPQADPIVRVEAGRLRQALARYYASEGSSDPIVIDVPRGSYVPCFRHREADSPQPLAEDAGDTLEMSSRTAEIVGHGRQLGEALTRFHELVEIQRLRIAAVSAEIKHARQTLQDSRDLLQVINEYALACGSIPPLLPTAPSLQSSAIGPADGRQEQRRQQAQGVPAARFRRPRAH